MEAQRSPSRSAHYRNQAARLRGLSDQMSCSGGEITMRFDSMFQYRVSSSVLLSTGRRSHELRNRANRLSEQFSKTHLGLCRRATRSGNTPSGLARGISIASMLPPGPTRWSVFAVSEDDIAVKGKGSRLKGMAEARSGGPGGSYTVPTAHRRGRRRQGASSLARTSSAYPFRAASPPWPLLP